MTMPWEEDWNKSAPSVASTVGSKPPWEDDWKAEEGSQDAATAKPPWEEEWNPTTPPPPEESLPSPAPAPADAPSVKLQEFKPTPPPEPVVAPRASEPIELRTSTPYPDPFAPTLTSEPPLKPPSFVPGTGTSSVNATAIAPPPPAAPPAAPTAIGLPTTADQEPPTTLGPRTTDNKQFAALAGPPPSQKYRPPGVIDTAVVFAGQQSIRLADTINTLVQTLDRWATTAETAYERGMARVAGKVYDVDPTLPSYDRKSIVGKQMDVFRSQGKELLKDIEKTYPTPDITKDPLVMVRPETAPQFWAGTIAGGIVQFANQIIAGGATKLGAIASGTLQEAVPVFEELRKKMSEPEAFIRAASFGGIVAALEKFGLDQIFKGPSRGVTLKAVWNGFTEMTSEYGEEVLEPFATSLGREGVTMTDFGRELMGKAVTGLNVLPQAFSMGAFGGAAYGNENRGPAPIDPNVVAAETGARNEWYKARQQAQMQYAQKTFVENGMDPSYAADVIADPDPLSRKAKLLAWNQQPVQTASTEPAPAPRVIPMDRAPVVDAKISLATGDAALAQSLANAQDPAHVEAILQAHIAGEDVTAVQPPIATDPRADIPVAPLGVPSTYSEADLTPVRDALVKAGIPAPVVAKINPDRLMEIGADANAMRDAVVALQDIRRSRPGANTAAQAQALSDLGRPPTTITDPGTVPVNAAVVRPVTSDKPTATPAQQENANANENGIAADVRKNAEDAPGSEGWQGGTQGRQGLSGVSEEGQGQGQGQGGAQVVPQASRADVQDADVRQAGGTDAANAKPYDIAPISAQGQAPKTQPPPAPKAVTEPTQSAEVTANGKPSTVTQPQTQQQGAASTLTIGKQTFEKRPDGWVNAKTGKKPTPPMAAAIAKRETANSAPEQTLTVEVNGESQGAVKTFQEASAKWTAARGELMKQGIRASDMGPVELKDASGKVVAHVAWNGNVFAGPGIYSSKGPQPAKLYDAETRTAQPVKALTPGVKETGSRVEKGTIFSSGLSRSPTDMRATISSGHDVGIALGEPISKRVMHMLNKHIQKGGRVFVDSGAFSKDKADDTPIDWAKTFDSYRKFLEDVPESTHSSVSLVMPDVLGDQEATVKLQTQFSDAIRSLGGARLIFPIQRQLNNASAQRPMAEVYADLQKAFPGVNITAGIPMRKNAWDKADIVKFAEDANPHSLHLLGVAERPILAEVAEAVHKVSPTTEIDSDATRGGGRGMSKSAREASSAKVQDALSAGIEDAKTPWGDDVTEAVGSLYMDPTGAQDLQDHIKDTFGLTVSVPRLVAKDMGLNPQETASLLNSIKKGQSINDWMEKQNQPDRFEELSSGQSPFWVLDVISESALSIEQRAKEIKSRMESKARKVSVPAPQIKETNNEQASAVQASAGVPARQDNRVGERPQSGRKDNGNLSNTERNRLREIRQGAGQGAYGKFSDEIGRMIDGGRHVHPAELGAEAQRAHALFLSHGYQPIFIVNPSEGGGSAITHHDEQWVILDGFTDAPHELAHVKVKAGDAAAQFFVDDQRENGSQEQIDQYRAGMAKSLGVSPSAISDNAVINDIAADRYQAMVLAEPVQRHGLIIEEGQIPEDLEERMAEARDEYYRHTGGGTVASERGPPVRPPDSSVSGLEFALGKRQMAELEQAIVQGDPDAKVLRKAIDMQAKMDSEPTFLKVNETATWLQKNSGDYRYSVDPDLLCQKSFMADLALRWMKDQLGSKYDTSHAWELMTRAEKAAMEVPCNQCMIYSARAKPGSAMQKKISSGVAPYDRYSGNKMRSVNRFTDEEITHLINIGLRNFTSTDGKPEHWPGLVVEFSDLRKLGIVPAFYTKDLDTVRFIASTGAPINISVGRDKRVSVGDIGTARRLRQMHPNVGIVYVGFSVKELVQAAQTPWVDKLIPWHGSGQALQLMRGRMKDADVVDWTSEQNDAVLSRKTNKNGKVIEKWVKAPVMIGDAEHRGDLATYLKIAKERGYRIRFPTIFEELKKIGRTDLYMKFIGQEYGKFKGQYPYPQHTLDFNWGVVDGAIKRRREFLESQDNGYMRLARQIVRQEKAGTFKQTPADPTPPAGSPIVYPNLILPPIKGEDIQAAAKSSTRVTAAQDAAYLAAVERGDTKKLQAMVDEAAKAAGYNVGPVWHGTNREFNRFNPGAKSTTGSMGGQHRLGVFFSTDKNRATEFAGAWNRGQFDSEGSRVVSAYLRMNNPKTMTYATATLAAHGRGAKNIQAEAVAQGHDGLRLTHERYDYENAKWIKEKPDEIVAFDPNQIKSADPITRDDQGRVIPLSERFNEKSDDIRFAAKTVARDTSPVEVPPESLTPDVLSRMNKIAKREGYDSRGSDDVRAYIIQGRQLADGTRLAPAVKQGKLSGDWAAFYREATQGSKARVDRLGAKKEAQDQHPRINRQRLRELGYTSDLREAGYITPNGLLIDLSGKREGGTAGTRSYDHREAGGTEGMLEFMAEGNVRINGDQGQIDIAVAPTRAQMDVIEKLIRKNDGEVFIDLQRSIGKWNEEHGRYEDDGKSDRQFIEPTKGDNPRRILNQISQYFSTGMQFAAKTPTKPMYSALQRVVESLPETLFRDEPGRVIAGRRVPGRTITDPKTGAVIKEISERIEPDKKVEASTAADALLREIKARAEKGEIKMQEVEETGFADWLQMQKDNGVPVTKESAAAFLRENGVKLETVSKGGGDTSFNGKPVPDGAVAWKYADAVDGARWIYEEDEAKSLEREGSSIKWMEGEKAESATKFAQYAPPGGVPGTYREVLLTVPDTRLAMTKDERKEYAVLSSLNMQGVNLSTEEVARLESLKQKERSVTASQDSAYQSPHWSEPNVIAHILADERVNPDGTRDLHMIEGQSDIHSLGQAKGYRISEERKAKLDSRRQEIEALGKSATSEQKQEWADIMNELPFAMEPKPPSLPFKGDAWKRLVIRKMLQHAVEGGYDTMSWSTGADRAAKWGSERVEWRRQQASPSMPAGRDVFRTRYDADTFSKRKDLVDARVVKTSPNQVISSEKYPWTVEWNEGPVVSYWTVAGTEQSGGEHDGQNIEALARERGILLEQKGQTVRAKEDLKRIVEGILRNPESGKVDKLTDRIWARMQTEPEGTSMPRKEFFEFLYDKSFVNEANDILRKMDKTAKVESTGVVMGGPKVTMNGDYIVVLPDGRYLDEEAGQLTSDINSAYIFDTEKEAAQAYGQFAKAVPVKTDGRWYAQAPDGSILNDTALNSEREALEWIGKNEKSSQHAIVITPAMRDSIAQGQPMFAAKGRLSRKETAFVAGALGASSITEDTLKKQYGDKLGAYKFRLQERARLAKQAAVDKARASGAAALAGAKAQAKVSQAAAVAGVQGKAATYLAGLKARMAASKQTAVDKRDAALEAAKVAAAEIPLEKRGKLIPSIGQAPDKVEARAEDIIEEVRKAKAKSRFKKAIPTAKELAGMRPALRDKIVEVTEGIDTHAMTPATRERIIKMAQWMGQHQAAGTMPVIPQDTLDGMIEEIGRLGKKTLDDYEPEELDGITQLIQGYVHQQKLIDKLQDKQAAREAARDATDMAADMEMDRLNRGKPYASVRLANARGRNAFTRGAIPIARFAVNHYTRGMLSQENMADLMGPTAKRILHDEPYAALSEHARLVTEQWDSLKDKMATLGYEWGAADLQKLSEVASGRGRATMVPVRFGSRDIEMTPAEIAGVMMHAEQPYTAKQMQEGKYSMVPRSADIGAEPIPVTLGDVSTLISQYPEYLRLGRAMRETVAEMRDAGNAASMAQDGIERYDQENYWPISTVSTYRDTSRKGQAEAEQMYSQSYLNTPANLAFNKARRGTSNVVWAEDAFGAFGSHAHGMSAYIAMMPAIRKAQAVLGSPVVKTQMLATYGPELLKKLHDRLAAWTLVSQPGEGAGDTEKGVAALMHNVVRAKLSFNPSPILKQPAGLLTIATEIDDNPIEAWRLLVKYGFPAMKKPMWHELVHMYAPLLRERAENVASRLVSPESGRPKPLLGHEAKRDKLMRGLTWADENNSVAAFAAFAQKIKEQNPTWNHDQIYSEAGRLAQIAVGRTQNSSNVMDATDVSLQAKQSMWLRLATTFQSQSMANYNTIVRASRRYHRSGKTGGDKAKYAHDVLMASLMQSMWTGLVSSTLGWATWAAIRAMFREPDEEKRNREGFVQKTALTAMGDMVGLGGPGSAETADFLKALYRTYEGQSFYNATMQQRDNIIGDTASTMTKTVLKLAGAKDAGDIREGVVLAAKSVANAIGAPEFPVNLANKAVKVYNEKNDPAMQRSKILSKYVARLPKNPTKADIDLGKAEAVVDAIKARVIPDTDVGKARLRASFDARVRTLQKQD